MIEEMKEWFFKNYEDPANKTPFESAAGGYQYIWGGPYYADDQLASKFGDELPEDVIDEAVAEIESDGIVEWAPRNYGEPEWEDEFSSNPPPQRSAIIKVEVGDDGKVHRRLSQPPVARDEAQEQRLRAAWAAHAEQLASLEELDPTRNTPALGRAMELYRAALGSSYDEMNVIAVGVHGASLEAYAGGADKVLLEDAAAELVGLAAAHGLFIRQFDAWLDYLSDASGEPTSEIVEAGIGVARSTRNELELIAEDVAIPIIELADAAEPPLTADPEDRPPLVVQRELLRSVGNVLSGLFGPLVDYARDLRVAARKGTITGTEKDIEEFSKRAA